MIALIKHGMNWRCNEFITSKYCPTTPPNGLFPIHVIENIPIDIFKIIYVNIIQS